ncbi:MAG: glutamine--fructose-6-phosphate transaminase (isomerizing) [Candidatus Dadabacteria bacterium]|nr:MAG: glutamine--fructose-6-phosphate transaminase (isomerizing) [Candidatus Dadabacteria bacterium]
MCGIVGYLGHRLAVDVLIEGLKRLEYRGYDSAGIAVLDPEPVTVFRCKGRIADLEAKIAGDRPDAHAGLGHTRWATHGRPSEENAHPHRVEHTVVVHNGIIENHLELRQQLIADGATFSSETDSEIFAHLIARELSGNDPSPEQLFEAVRNILPRVDGSYALGVLHGSCPGALVFARHGSPLILGIGEGELFAASDIPAILNYTREMVILEDGDIALLQHDGLTITDGDGAAVTRKPLRIAWDPVLAEKGGYPHFMLKEIHEQPRAISDTLAGRVALDRGEVFFESDLIPSGILDNVRQVVMVACGTSFHAGLTAAYEFERHLRVPTRVEFASEYRYREPIIDEHTLVVAISQSGETADTLAAVELARSRGAYVVAVCNVLESSIARAAHAVAYTHAGPEISVASTKAFVTQLVTLHLLLLYLDQQVHRLDGALRRRWLTALSHLPTAVAELIEDCEPVIKRMARRYAHARDMLYLGRDVHYPLAMEGALKLKEISYMHAEAYPAGEMKHGPIALVDADVPVLFVVHDSPVRSKVIANIEEIRAREGRVIALTLPGDEEVAEVADDRIEVPSVDPLVDAVLLAVPLQLFAYYVAVHLGTDVDQPRNLAKSVTVE